MENKTVTELVEELREVELAYEMARTQGSFAVSFEELYESEQFCDEFERESHELALELDRRFEETFPQ